MFFFEQIADLYTQTKAPGIYSLANGNLVTIETFGAACPEVGGVQCDGHGTCDEQSFTCKCSAAYWGVACESVCPGGPSTPCSNHGTCNQQDGSCKCSLGYVSRAARILSSGGFATHPPLRKGSRSLENFHSSTSSFLFFCSVLCSWASCSSQNDCSSNVSQDPNNCGGCGIVCKVRGASSRYRSKLYYCTR